MSTATYQPREKEERVAMAIGLSTIERVKSKARIVFERTRPRESVSKNNGVFNPYPYARSFRSSFPLFSSRILARTLRSWWKRDLVWFCCSYLLYRLCFSSLKGALWKSAGVVSSIFRCFVNNEFLLLFPLCFLFFFFLPFYLCFYYDEASFQRERLEYQVSLLVLSRKGYLVSLSIVVSETITSQCDTIYKRARGRGNEINFLRDRSIEPHSRSGARGPLKEPLVAAS